MRSEWISKRKNDESPTQMYYAKKGIITEEMRYVTESEYLDAETIREKIAVGHLVIPANINHANLTPLGIGE
ncbi:MAG: phosphomethylpyrimidine synthase ThiC, partial [Nitrospinota bacterium]